MSSPAKESPFLYLVLAVSSEWLGGGSVEPRVRSERATLQGTPAFPTLRGEMLYPPPYLTTPIVLA